MTPRLKQTISNEIEPTLKEKFGYKNLYMGARMPRRYGKHHWSNASNNKI